PGPRAALPAIAGARRCRCRSSQPSQCRRTLVLVIPDKPREGDHPAAALHHLLAAPKHRDTPAEYPNAGKRRRLEHLPARLALKPSQTAEHRHLAPRSVQGVHHELFGVLEGRIRDDVVGSGLVIEQEVDSWRAIAAVYQVAARNLVPGLF